MGDNNRTGFDGNDSDEDIERPPTPQFHDGSGDDENLPAGGETVDGTNDGANEGTEEGREDKPDNPEESLSDTIAKEEGNEGSSLNPVEQEPSSSPNEPAEDLEESNNPEVAQDKEDVVAASDKSAEVEGNDNDMELDDNDGEQEPAAAALPDEAPKDVNADESRQEVSKADSGRLRRVSAASGGTGTEDEDLEMPISPIGDFGLTGIETEIADDILKNDVSEFLPEGEEDIEEPVKAYEDDKEKDEGQGEEKDEERGDNKDDETAAAASQGGAGDQDGEGSDQGEEGGDQLIADIFGASDEEEEEFEGFGQADIEVTKRKKGAREQQKKSRMPDDEDKDDLRKELTVPKPPKESDSEDSEEERPVFVSDFDEMIKRKKEVNRGNRRRRRDYDIISDSDDLVVQLINQMKEAAEEDKLLNGAKQAATKKLKLYQSVYRQLNKVDLQMTFLDCGVLPILKEWLSPLPDGSLPHVQIREGLLRLLTQFPRVDTGALKVSGLGKAVMYLYRHPKETRENKNMAGKLINDWARPIFGVTANFKSLSREEREKRDYQNMSKRRRLSSTDIDGGRTPKSIDSALQGEKKALRPGDKGFIMRARVPLPSNKEYVVRPKSATEDLEFSRSPGKSTLTRYDKQLRKFKEKKKSNKMQKAVGISLEGRKMAL